MTRRRWAVVAAVVAATALAATTAAAVQLAALFSIILDLLKIVSLTQ